MGRVLLTRRLLSMFATILAASIALDQAVKVLVRGSLDPGETIPLIDGVLHLTHVRNTGAAFGLIPGGRVMFIAVAVAVLVGIGIYLWVVKPTSRWAVFALGLTAGGAVGNLIDRAIAGRVTDFIDFRVFPVFNIADSCIVVGTAMLVLWSLFAPGGETGEGAEADDAGSAARNGESLDGEVA